MSHAGIRSRRFKCWATEPACRSHTPIAGPLLGDGGDHVAWRIWSHYDEVLSEVPLPPLPALRQGYDGRKPQRREGGLVIVASGRSFSLILDEKGDPAAWVSSRPHTSGSRLVTKAPRRLPDNVWNGFEQAFRSVASVEIGV